MEAKKIEGLVVNEALYKESSKILTIFTKEYGLISVLSRGCRKQKSKLREVSSKLIYADFYLSYKENGLSTLISADIKDYFRHLLYDPKDLLKKTYAFYVLDLSLQVLKQDTTVQEEIYNLLLATLKKMNEGFPPEILSLILELKYLDYLGVRPSFDGCSNCGSNQNIVTFDSKCNGFICHECYTDEKIIQKESLKMIRMLYYVNISKIQNLNIKKEILEEISSLVDDYYNDHTGIYLKTKKSIEEVYKLMGVIGEK